MSTLHNRAARLAAVRRTAGALAVLRTAAKRIGQRRRVHVLDPHHGLAATAFHTLISSKKPSLPATPSSILDFVAWPMPEDLRKPAGLPSMVTRISSPTVSTTSVYHLPDSSLTGWLALRPARSLATSAFRDGSC